ncbi:hypothetical protein ACFSCW_05015 [Sphingomonas tabacisoli]|uniref:Uncharacterized protein n=1 Tax=Sphingomonas tabacisoli TaxID=2249466 RepID=A0ABW4HZR9_9SPHN
MPFLVNEGVWIGLLVPPSTDLVSATVDGIALAFADIGEYPSGDRFLRSAPFGGDGRDANVEVTLYDEQGTLGMRLALMASSAFTARFGAGVNDQPAPTTYGKWRLP